MLKRVLGLTLATVLGVALVGCQPEDQGGGGAGTTGGAGTEQPGVMGASPSPDGGAVEVEPHRDEGGGGGTGGSGY